MSKSTSDPNFVIASAIETFRWQKNIAESAIVQVDDEQLHKPLDPETNSIAGIMKHMAGNLRSRWTNFLTRDGEKPWRHRDDEFVEDMRSRKELFDLWEAGWACVFDAVSQLSDQDLEKIVEIRGKPHTVIRAMHRAIDHNGYHVGQIVQIARIRAQDNWTTLSIPRGESEQYNQRTWQT